MNAPGSPHTGGNTPWNGRNASGMILCDYAVTRGSEVNDNAYKGHLMNDNINGQPTQRTRLSTLGGGRLDVGVQQTGWVLVVDGSPTQGGVVSIFHHLWEQVAEPTKPPARRLSTEVTQFVAAISGRTIFRVSICVEATTRLIWTTIMLRVVY